MISSTLVHKCIMESGMLPDLKAKNALVDMYTIVARWKQLWEFSEGMQAGQFREALEFFFVRCSLPK